MTLYVLRHGVAEDAVPGGDDRTRRLTARGRAKMRAVAAGLRALGLHFDAILTSPLPRAAETATIVSAAYGGTPVPAPLPALATGVAPAQTLVALRPFARCDHLMIVGHEPGLSRLASLVLSGSPDGFALELKKGGCVAIEVAKLAPPSGAMLLWHLTPRQLRRLGR